VGVILYGDIAPPGRISSPPFTATEGPLHFSMSQETDAPRRAYGYCFTLNNYSAEDELHLQGLRGVQYLIYGREVGDSGTPHLQGYIHYINNKSFQSVKNDIPRAHVERRQGTIDQAVEYCRKDSDVYEKGKKPRSQREKGETSKLVWTEIVSAAESGNHEWIRDNHPRVYFTHYSRCREIQLRQPSVLDGDLTNEWWVGPTGTGKSRLLWERHPKHFHKQLNKWWCGYNGESVVAVEEWCPKNECTGSQLKIWADRYPFTAQIKGGSLGNIRPTKFIVLSNYTIEECFPNVQDQEPIKRRFKVVRFQSL